MRIFGERIRVRAKIHTLGGFSAHAGATELIEWVDPLVRNGAKVVLTHGEEDSREALGARLKERYGINVKRPRQYSEIAL